MTRQVRCASIGKTLYVSSTRVRPSSQHTEPTIVRLKSLRSFFRRLDKWNEDELKIKEVSHAYPKKLACSADRAARYNSYRQQLDPRKEQAGGPHKKCACQILILLAPITEAKPRQKEMIDRHVQQS
jgi:hypothetical protein